MTVDTLVRAQGAMNHNDELIRVGISPMTPPEIFVELWPKITLEDLAGENLMLMQRGWSYYGDKLRDDMIEKHPESKTILIILSCLYYTFIHSMSLRFVIVSEQLNYIKTRWFHAIFMPVIIEFLRCIGTYSSASFQIFTYTIT